MYETQNVQGTACLVLTFALLLPMTVGALADTTIGTDASRPEYFEALGGSGSYNPLKTPYHYDKTTGNVAYCLEHKKDSPSSSAAYTDFDPSALWGHNTVTGIQAIVDHGYPNSCGGLSEEQAHYATANAIRAWMKESADVGYNFMRVDEGHIRPLSGTAAQETWVFFLELLGYARAGATLGGTSGGMVRVYPANPVWEVQGNQLVTRIEVSSSDGYTIRRSSAEVDIAGYTGGTEDTLTLTAPLSLLTQDVQLLFTANAGAGVTLYWYEPVSASSQSVVVAELGGGSGGTGEQQLVTIAGQKLVDLTVVKQDGSTGEALDGAVFALTDAAGKPVGLTQTGAGRYTAGGNNTQFTTSGGTAMITGLTAGTYTLTEVSTPGAGYAGMEPETLQLTASATVTVTNVPTEITITKVDGLTGEALSGMEFCLLDESGSRVSVKKDGGSYRPAADGSAVMTTDTNGRIHVIGLPVGTYSVEESTHPGYAALSASPQFTLTSAADITITNEPLTLELTKVDGYTGDPLPGVRFSLRDADGNAVPIQSIAEGLYYFNASAQGNTLVTGADGKATVHYLPAGVYTLEEEPQAGYAQAAPVQVAVSTGSGLSEPAQVRFANAPTLLLLTKSDAATREPLDGATFRLLDENGNVVRLDALSSGNYKPGESGQETFTTQKGEAYLRYLAPGNYTVEEVSAPSGYTMDAPKAVTLTDANSAANPVRVTMQDAPLALEFRKLDAETDAPLDGCTFGLKDADGKTVQLRKVSDGVYTPDEKGSATFTTSDGKATIARIDPGTYTLCEITPADGYAQAQDVHVTVTQTSTADKPVTVTMKNQKLALRITKVDAQTRQTLPGAAFQLTDAHGKTVKIVPIPGKPDTCEVAENGSDTFTIPQSGSLTILKLPVGEFTLTETRAPVGYAKAEKPQKVLITNEHTADAPSQAVVENRALAVQVTKTDGLTGARLPGVRFRIELPTGAALRF